MRVLPTFALALFALPLAARATCDGNPHGWGRLRRCDAYNAACPNASWAGHCGVCEGIGGIPTSDAIGDIAITKHAPNNTFFVT